MKTFFERIVKWYLLNFIYVHFVVFILYLILYVILHEEKILETKADLWGILSDIKYYKWQIIIYYLITLFGYIITLFGLLLSSYIILINIVSPEKITMKFRSSIRNAIGNLQNSLFVLFYKNIKNVQFIGYLFFAFLTIFLIKNPFPEYNLINGGLVKYFLLSSVVSNFMIVFLVTISSYELLLPIHEIEKSLSPLQSEEESRYEELRSRFAFHNITKDIRNLKLYVDILKNEEPQLLSKFTPLDELMEMIGETLHKFKNSDTIRTKNPFLIYELFDNFLTLNKPDLIREGSNLQISYHNSESKDLAIHQVFYDVYQVLNNLIDNARKAIAKTEHKEIHIFTEVKTEGFVIFQVSDTGVGIDAKSRNRIFDIGYSTTNGDGLGLLFVQTTLKRFGGEITLLPDALSGFSTTFEVKIPIQKTT